eukprot:gene16293-11650_t
MSPSSCPKCSMAASQVSMTTTPASHLHTMMIPASHIVKLDLFVDIVDFVDVIIDNKIVEAGVTVFSVNIIIARRIGRQGILIKE